MNTAAFLDEMVDGAGSVRPHWRRLLGVMSNLGNAEMRARKAQLDRVFDEEGITALLPGDSAGTWRCDPVPLLLTEGEFSDLAEGLAQRAALLEQVLADLYGAQALLADGTLAPGMIWPNPSFLRPCRTTDGVAPPQRLQFYAADLVRTADRSWHVLADRTEEASGIAYLLENRRMMSRMVPELFSQYSVSPLRPFMDLWQDTLRALLPPGGEGAGVAVLTSGSSDPQWCEHVLLARELSCALVEGGDLTVRGGRLFLKTLRGLRPVALLLRRAPGNGVDPLELAPASGFGVPGLLDAIRSGAVRVVNDPGSALAESPVITASLPRLAQRLLGQRLLLPSVEMVWLGEPDALARVQSNPQDWRLRPAFDGRGKPIDPTLLSGYERADLLRRVTADPGSMVAFAAPKMSEAPCIGADGMTPRRVVLRMFLISDGIQWRALPGGLARVLGEADLLGDRLPRTALSKDVWVLGDHPAPHFGLPAVPAPVLAIRHTAGDLPSRVADNFFWLGRYLERLEGGCRLQRAAFARIVRASPSPPEISELQMLTASLTSADIVPDETDAALGAGLLCGALLVSLREGGRLPWLIGHLVRITELLRDRMTDEMHLTMTVQLRELRDALRLVSRDDRQAMEQAASLIQAALAYSATMSGLIAENMVRGGGRLFLDLGRRVERAQAIAGELVAALAHPLAARQPGRVETGLRLVLELRDSVLTYRSRYLAVMQPAPALDLVLTDAGNPRGFAFQLAEAQALLAEIEPEAPFADQARALHEQAEAMVRDVLRAADQTEAAAGLVARLKQLRHGVSTLSDDVSRRYFAVLPPLRSLGMGAQPTRPLRGAA